MQEIQVEVSYVRAIFFNMLDRVIFEPTDGRETIGLRAKWQPLVYRCSAFGAITEHHSIIKAEKTGK